MEDKDIIKALEDIIKHLNFTQIKSGENVLANALDLINRQKAEIEKLEKGLRQVLTDVKEAKLCVVSDIKTARAEAITEYENKVLDLFPSDKNYTTVSKFSIKQIAKELKEGVTDTNVGSKEEGEQ